MRMGIKEPVELKAKDWYNQPVTVMKDFRLIRPVLMVLAAAAIGCGAAATLPPETEPTNLTPALSQAVWHPEVGDQLSITTIGSPVSLEDGSLSLSSVSIRPVDAQSSFVHGVMLVDIPDEPQVAIVSSVGFDESAPTGESARFTIYIQEDGRFVPLSEVTASSDGHLDPISADLSAYRGQNRMIVLSAASESGAPLTVATVWVGPTLRIP